MSASAASTPEPLPSKTPVTIVTGFLGSGKTTLVNRALRDPSLRRAAVIVNEFGEIGLDHELIETSNDMVVLLPNGCLCCAVRSDLVATLGDLQKRRARGTIPAFDHVLLETSGLAEPAPVLEVLASEVSVKAYYAPSGVVTTVDALNGTATLETHIASLKQVALADRIVITKTDLLRGDHTHLPILLGNLRALNPIAEIVDARTLDPGETLRISFGPVDELHRRAAPPVGYWPVIPQSVDQHNGRIHRFSLIRDYPWPRRTLELFLAALRENAGPALLRVKGIINVAETPENPVVVHGVQTLLHNAVQLPRWPSKDRRTRIVFITIDFPEEEIRALMEGVERLCNGAARAGRRAPHSI